MKFDGWLLEAKTDEAKAQLEMEKAKLEAAELAEQEAFEKAIASGSGEKCDLFIYFTVF